MSRNQPWRAKPRRQWQQMLSDIRAAAVLATLQSSTSSQRFSEGTWSLRSPPSADAQDMARLSLADQSPAQCLTAAALFSNSRPGTGRATGVHAEARNFQLIQMPALQYLRQ